MNRETLALETLAVFGHVEHGHAAALGGGEIVHGLEPSYWIY